MAWCTIRDPIADQPSVRRVTVSTKIRTLARLLRESFRRDALVLWLPIAVVLLVGATLSVHANFTLRTDRNLVVHSYRIIEAGQELLSGVSDAETGQRGYLITGERRYLEPYEAGQLRSANALLTLGRLVADNQQQIARVARLRSLVEAKNAELAEVLTVRDRNGFQAARDLVAADRGKMVMDETRSTLTGLNAAEAAILQIREAEVQRDEFAVFAIGGMIAVASLLVRVFVAMLKRRREPGAQSA